MRVVIADDQPRIRSALRLVVEQDAALDLVGEAADATALLRKLTMTAPPDLVLLDWELPGLSGRQLLRLLRFERPEIRVLVLSGRPEAEEAARAAGADAFVGKGDSTSHLLQVLQDLRDSRDRGGEEDIYRGR